MDALTLRQFAAEICLSSEPDFELTEVASIACFLGYSEEELGGKPLKYVIPAESADKVLSRLRSQIAENGEIELILPLSGKDGITKNVIARGKITGNCVRGVILEAEGLIGTLRAQKKELEEYRQKLSQSETMVSTLTLRAEKDSLTQLFNSGTTRTLSETYLTEPQKSCAVIIIDVDDFKHINDRYGHMVGDRVMCHAAEIIKKLFRSGDIVGRIGGDEFLVLMKDVSDRSIAELRCSQIVKAFNTIECEQIKGHSLSCSVGAALAPIHGKTYDALFCRADNAMYRAKRAGGNRFIIEA